MKKKACLRLAISLVLVVPAVVASQDDETRQATGLPTMVGENVARGNRMNVSGRIQLETTEKPIRRPIITVTVLLAGVTAEKAIANDAGYYLIRNVPRENISIVVEVDGMEVVRQPVIVPPMSNPRFDLTIPWSRGSTRTAAPAVISAGDHYQRTDKNDALFRRALEYGNGNNLATAVELFNQILQSDPKDFVAWTELGTVYFRTNSADNAEACYFKAIELKKEYFPALLNLGKLYLGPKRSSNAVLVLSNAVASRPSSADAHHYLAEAYLQSKKGSAAVHHFNEAIKISPTDKADLHLRLAVLYDAAGSKGKAAQEYKLFLAKRPDHAEKKQLEKYISDNPAN